MVLLHGLRAHLQQDYLRGRFRGIYERVTTTRFMAAPTLRVIQGSAKSCPTGLDFPSTLVALSPFDKSKPCRFRVSREDASKAARARRLQPIWDIWSAVIGEPPPVPNVRIWGVNVPAEEGLTTLVEAHACFRGVNRALAEDDNGDNVVAYILKPSHFYEHVTTNMVCAASKRPTPQDLVYALHVRLDIPCDLESATIGVITHGGFVRVGSEDSLLPEDHASRYTSRLW
jgi:hypothetical protein